MKTNLNIFSGMIAGSLLTMLVIFFLKPTFLSSNSNPSIDPPDAPELISENSEVVTEPCDDDCLDAIIDDLIAGTNLSNKFGVSIREANAKKVASKLQTQPETVEKIAARLSSLEGQDDRDAILFTFSYFPIEQVEQFAQRLLNSKNIQNRSDGLSLLYHIADSSDQTIGTLQQAIQNDTNDEIAIDAIQILYGVYPDQVGDISRQRLNQILVSETSDEIRSNALQTKASFFETNDEVKQDIFNALSSPIQRFKETGIQVLDDVFRRQSNGTAAGDWRSDESLRQAIEKIANNTDAAPFTRVEALNLMRRHYY